MASESIRLNGKIVYVMFHSETTYYTAARFEINDEYQRTITVTGLFPEVPEDELIDITGHYVEHPKYGMQFQIESYEKPLPSEEAGIIRYLSGVQFAGIGKKTAEKIVNCLGTDCLQKIKDDPSIVKTVPGLSEKHIKAIEEGIAQEADGMEELVRFLNVHGIGMRNLVRLNKAYGKEALAKIKENPYRVIEDCDGFGFKTADKVAMSLGFAQDDERRLYALLVASVMDLCMASGDTYVRYEALEASFRKKVGNIDCDFDALLQEAVDHKRLIREEDRIYDKSQYEAETGIADFIRQFPYADLDPAEPEILKQYLEAMEKDFEISYEEDQIQAIQSFFDNPLMIMTGGPGTGKTTVVRAMVRLFRLTYPSASIVCAAPTGRAAKRLAELTGTGTTTIHSLLQWDLETNTFSRNKDNPVEADLLIIDEFSMVDSFLFANLLKASRNIRKICLIGDEDQLPSVGPGNVLKDLIDSRICPLIRLHHIYRQKSGSDVIALAHAVNEGQVDLKNYSGDVAFFSCPVTEVRKNVIKVVDSALAKGYTMDDIQVLSPMYSGMAGIDVLNNALQESFNPREAGKKELKAGYITFREGDKILQLKNQPDDDVYNGDIGRLAEIVDAKESEDHKTHIVVDYQDNYVEYNPDTWANITLAYCISIHKSQGGEYPIVIMPFTRQHAIMMQRKLIYTGITRASKALVLLGDPDVFQRGISIVERHPRQTSLCMRLQESADKEKSDKQHNNEKLEELKKQFFDEDE